MWFFYVVALPLVVCAVIWGLLFLPSSSTGKQAVVTLLPVGF
jgi:hypothetical protein